MKVCLSCGSNEVKALNAGDETLDVCQECGSVENAAKVEDQ